MTAFFRDAGIAAIAALVTTSTLLIFVALPVAMWGSSDSTKFYGALFGSMVSAAAAVIAVIVSARQTAQADEAKARASRRERLTSLARLAHAELVGSSLGVRSFVLSLETYKSKGAKPEHFLLLMDTWKALMRSPTIDQHALELCKLGPKAAAALSSCLHARANYAALLQVWEDKAKGGLTLQSDHVAKLQSLGNQLPFALFMAAQQIKEMASKHEAWSELAPEELEKLQAEWTQYQQRLASQN